VPPSIQHPLIDPHSRSSGLLGLLSADEPLVAADSSDRNACWELHDLFGVVGWQQVGEIPAGLSHRSQLFGCVGAVRGPPA